jgi:hypothetical protein
MAARLDMILAHLQALTLDVPANLIVANLMNARYSGAPARDTKLKIDKPEMNEALARNVVDKVAGPAFRAAYDKAIEAAGRINGFTKEHPVWTVVIVLCILAVMYPAAIKALGFGLEGVVEGNNPLVVWASSFELTELPGSYAAGWQSTYGAAVPAGSLFSCLQRVGATMAF